jgi:hypothetical protein
MNPTTTALIEELGKEIACAELPTVIKWINSLKSKVPQVGFRHFTLLEIGELLEIIETDLDCNNSLNTNAIPVSHE